jgi:hypothetical protein
VKEAVVDRGKAKMLRQIAGVYDAPTQHWVGDGFPVRSLFSYHSHADRISPFLLLDYAEPTEFAPAAIQRGVGQHPHRGFETVTIVYAGEVTHRDSSGGGGTIRPGDVQWMTAASGVIHDEFHSADFSRTGGVMEMVQLWVNLPAADKMTQPGYQALSSTDIPVINLPDDVGRVRVIAGNFLGQDGPAHTHTAINVWDVHLANGARTRFEIPQQHNLILVVRSGSMSVNDTNAIGPAQLVLFAGAGQAIDVYASEDSDFLLLSGQPIDEPIAGYGPFVMNSAEEIREAIEDFNSGRFGNIAAPRENGASL